MSIVGLGSVSNQWDNLGFQARSSSREIETKDEAYEQDRAKAAQIREDSADFIRKYVRTYGAPEEEDQQHVAEEFLMPLGEEEEERKAGLNPRALTTEAIIIRDPNDPGQTHVYTMKTDVHGKGKITRKTSFDSGDGEDRSQLTPERAKANKAYERGLAPTEEHDKEKKLDASV